MCQPGYQLIGDSHSTCSLIGKLGLPAWSDSLPKCQLIVYCNAVKLPENCDFKSDNDLTDFGYYYNTTLEFTCFEGKYL